MGCAGSEREGSSGSGKQSLSNKPKVELALSEETLGALLPIAVYWTYSALYVLLGSLSSLDKYRLHPRGDEAKNIVSRATVVKGVLVQQAFQVVVALGLFTGPTLRHWSSGSMGRGMGVLDTWQYFMHRYMHVNKFLYKHVHSKDHTLVGLILDTVGGALSFLVSGMSARDGIFFFSSATIKTVDDHCGLWLPGNPLHALFGNNSAYHDIHHQLYGSKCNFSQPFFVAWDRIMGTYMPYTLEKEGRKTRASDVALVIIFLMTLSS
ncbi:unnamed protein product [Spirodela intermedia]|uniref:aldehyde oxygenase (deformylating) n=1 Tax=Spirodela intermedia TaxID=51605 RepID=A0A7I8J4Z8_SPIIN|nr:unnamed protein product [Spirodela intermedia]CAA6665171.1 unnamed protein product [Spirodela intermedia]